MYARLMKANLDRLIDGAAGAATATHDRLHGVDADLAILVSCIGRKMVLRQRVEEEVENVRDVMGPRIREHLAAQSVRVHGVDRPKRQLHQPATESRRCDARANPRGQPGKEPRMRRLVDEGGLHLVCLERIASFIVTRRTRAVSSCSSSPADRTRRAGRRRRS